MKNKSNKNIFIIIGIFSLLLISFYIYNKVVSADVAADKIAIKSIKIKSIETGTSFFDDNDGLDYSNEPAYSAGDGYIPGNDNNKDNRIIRTFDELKYNFEYQIKSKDDYSDYEERKVDIKVILPDNVAKYVSFSKDSLPGETSKIFTFEGIDTYGTFSSSISLYVLGAPNGLKISPKFEIQESTNTDLTYLINLGSISFETDVINYEYDIENSNVYNTKSSIRGFNNYMPTIVSSKSGDLAIKVLPQNSEGQSANYNEYSGRYLTYVLGLNLIGDNTKGIKGLTMPNGEDISFDINMSQNGKIDSLFNDIWFRLYSNNNIENINSVVVAHPYSVGTNIKNSVKYPGSIEIKKNNDTSYKVKIKNYGITYENASINADGSEIAKDTYYIGAYALTIFSPRTIEDGKNDITSTISINNINVKDTNNVSYLVSPVSSSIINKYYEYVDYSLTSSFYDDINNKLSSDGNGKGSTSKGASIVYKTSFNYKKTLSNDGLKEIIKIDPNAYRVIPLNGQDVKITISGSDEIKASDFDITFISGDYNQSNYTINNDVSRISEEDKSIVSKSCQSLNIANLSNDQIMNLYGGPCIKSNEGVEKIFDNISSAKTSDNTEIPITKVVIQTKKGVKLPDSVVVNVELGLRVRNVNDLTQSYQVTSVAMSSDYDENLVYYSPRITNDINSITNPNNYIKTVYNGSSIANLDTDSLWGDSLKIVNFTSREEITVLNKNADGSIKTSYNANNGDTIIYRIKTAITDENMNVGADDVWYINNLKISVFVPNGLIYVPDNSLGNPSVEIIGNDTILTYTLPYTKPNQKIDDITFKATISPTLKGSAIPLTVKSTVKAINVNNEEDLSYFGLLSDNFTIYVTGIENIIVSQKIGDQGTKIEKNGEFSYLLDIYNNTNNDITDYSIVDILPYNGDTRGSEYNGSYKVKVDIPSSLGKSKIYCSTIQPSKIANEVFSNLDDFKECNITDDYLEVTAIKITNIPINANSYTESIKISIKTSKNEYSDKYVNSFVGASKTYSQNESNLIEASVVSRKISGRVFIDVNENGIEDDVDKYYEDMPMTLYKLDNENNLNEIDSVTTNKDGYYEFKNLDSGRYKIRASYNNSLYDLTLRYATEDTTIDSDGYKVLDNIIEISSKSTPNESSCIRLNNSITNVKDMNIGLISKKSFGFDISKYITKIDLTYNNAFLTYNYENQSKVSLSLKNSLNASAKVYYGIKITNNSTTAGYVKLINENIPFGLYFDETEEVNKDWFYYNGELRSISLENDLISPGESKYLTIVLNMPSQTEARTYINTVTILDILEYEPEKLSNDIDINSNLYEIGEDIRYAGIDWHVVNTEDKDGGEQILTLLADSGTISSNMGHTSSKDEIYKWSSSKINQYLNNDFYKYNSLNLPILIDNAICDDASGLPIASFGGTLVSEGKCQSGIYNDYKVRLLTEKEYNDILSKNLSDYSWLYGKEDFWLMNSVFINQEYDSYGQIKDLTNVKNLAKFISKSTTSIQSGYNSSDISKWITADTKKEIRPVIMISNKNIIAE